jgi:hypothetical protein
VRLINLEENEKVVAMDIVARDESGDEVESSDNTDSSDE